MSSELNYRLRVLDDLATGGWKLLKWISLIIVPLVVLSGLLNFDKPDIEAQTLGGLGGLFLINAFFFSLHRFFRSWRLAVEREWPDR